MIAGSRINYDNISLLGRDIEITCLTEAYERVEGGHGQESIFIKGDSGSGKSSLLESFVAKHSNIQFFVRGKFDAISIHPMSAIFEALSQLCEQAASSDSLSSIRVKLQDSLGSNHELLRTTIPQSNHILGHDLSAPSISKEYNLQAIDRLQRSCRDLILACQEEEKVVVMCIDDLQWADEQSWDLIFHLIQDFKMFRFLFVGAYRQDELHPGRGEMIDAMVAGNFSQVIDLSNLDLQNINQLISSMLKMEKAITEPLARVVFAKSAGNPHYAIEILKTIEKQKLIHFSLINFRWEWDLQMIQTTIDVGDNIVDIILSRIATFPPQIQKTLILGSCFGPKFDAMIVEAVALKLFPSDYQKIIHGSFLIDALECAAKEGVVDRHPGSTVYRIVHDKIHQALYSLLPQIGCPDAVHLQIGCILHTLCCQKSDDACLTFLAAGQFNHSLNLIEGSSEAAKIAKLYLCAAKAAVKLAAFGSAAEYLRHGLYVIREDRWLEYETKLELLIYQTKVELSLGNFQNCRAAADEVIQGAKNLEEKIPVFQAIVDAYGAEGQIDACIFEGLRFAKILGVKLPQKFNGLSVVIALIKAKLSMRQKTKEKLLNYHRATDPSKIAIIRIINTLVTYSFQARKNDMMATLALINTVLTLRHGFTEEAGSIFAAYGLLMGWTGDFTNGCEVGEIGLAIAEKTKVGIPRTFMNYFGGLDHLRNPLHQSLEPLLRGYRVGFEVGDTVYGLYCCHFYLSIFYFVGLPLPNLLKDMESFSKEMESYNSSSVLYFLKIYHQSVINLTSSTTFPTLLDGEAMTEQSILNCGVQQCVEALWFGKLIMAIYFNEFDVMVDNLEKLAFGCRQNLDGCMHYVNMLLWTEGLGAIIAAKKTGKRKYRKLACKRLRKIEAWVKCGNVNCFHSLMHLRAEFAVLEGKPESKVKPLFDVAISASRRAGFSNFVAVISERAAYFYLDLNDIEWASSYMRSAFEMYQNWGALQKCTSLIQTHANLLPLSLKEDDAHSLLGSVSVGTSCQGRERHSMTVGKLHRGEMLDLFSDSTISTRNSLAHMVEDKSLPTFSHVLMKQANRLK